MSNKLFIDIIKENRKSSILAAFFKVLFALSVTFLSYYLSLLFDAFDKGRNEFYKSIVYACLILLSIVILSFVSDFFKALYIKSTNKSLKNKMAQFTIDTSYELIKDKDTGKTISWFINDANQIQTKAFENFINFIYMIALVISSFISIIFIHWSIAVLAVFLLTISLIVPKITNKYIVKAESTYSKANEAYTESIRDNLEAINIFFTGNYLSQFQKKMLATIDLKEESYFNFSMTQAKVSSLMLFTSLLAQIGLIIFAIFITSLGYTTGGSVIGVASLSGNFFNGVQGLMGTINLFSGADTLLNKFKSLTREKITFNESFNEVSFDKINFSYDDNIIFKNFSYKFIKGKKYVIIGESGSGKSTLLKLMMGFEKVDSGNIFANNKDISSIDLKDYYGHISYIDQSTYLINDTIRENILLGENISSENLEDIINKAQLSRFIKKQSKGLDTALTSNGQNISGGEKQRIALARALVKNVDFILIDESTSQLDKVTRREIEDTILSFKDIGLIYVSHNTDSEIIKRFDNVLDSKYFVS